MAVTSKRNRTRPPVKADAWLMLLCIVVAVVVLGLLFWVVFVGLGDSVPG